MDKDVLNYILEYVKYQMVRCESGKIIHEGKKDDAIETYEKVIEKQPNL